MAFDLGAICTGVKTSLAQINGLQTYDMVPDSDLVVPAAVVQPAMIRYQEAFKDGLVQARIRITVLCSASSDRIGQTQIYAYLSAGTGMTSSIVDALEDNPLLCTTITNGTPDTSTATADSSGIETEHEIDYGRTTINESVYWKADVDLKVLRARS